MLVTLLVLLLCFCFQFAREIEEEVKVERNFPNFPSDASTASSQSQGIKSMYTDTKKELEVDEEQLRSDGITDTVHKEGAQKVTPPPSIEEGYSANASTGSTPKPLSDEFIVEATRPSDDKRNEHSGVRTEIPSTDKMAIAEMIEDKNDEESREEVSHLRKIEIPLGDVRQNHEPKQWEPTINDHSSTETLEEKATEVEGSKMEEKEGKGIKEGEKGEETEMRIEKNLVGAESSQESGDESEEAAAAEVLRMQEEENSEIEAENEAIRNDEAVAREAERLAKESALVEEAEEAERKAKAAAAAAAERLLKPELATPGGNLRAPRASTQPMNDESDKDLPQYSSHSQIPLPRANLESRSDGSISMADGRVRNTARMNVNSNGVHHLESLIPEEVRERAAERDEAEQSKQARIERMKVPRKFARPIEIVLRAYGDGIRPDLYGVLSTSQSADDMDIRKAFKTAALGVHPDKNPHPDAEEAFDMVQAAYETLSRASQRDAYDLALAKRASWAYKVRKSLRILKDETYNLKARVKLFKARLDRDELDVEKEELVERIENVRTFFLQKWENFMAIPDLENRLLFVQERIHDHRYVIGSVAGYWLVGRTSRVLFGPREKSVAARARRAIVRDIPQRIARRPPRKATYVELARRRAAQKG